MLEVRYRRKYSKLGCNSSVTRMGQAKGVRYKLEGAGRVCRQVGAGRWVQEGGTA